jgi:hypothetical protein
MATFSSENEGFKSWARALAENKLTPEQLDTLKEMVLRRQAETLEGAARMLDWQDTVINPDEHMYGF